MDVYIDQVVYINARVGALMIVREGASEYSFPEEGAAIVMMMFQASPKCCLETLHLPILRPAIAGSFFHPNGLCLIFSNAGNRRPTTGQVYHYLHVCPVSNGCLEGLVLADAVEPTTDPIQVITSH